ncbi:MAG TPA: hypothetical protein VN326_04480 [Casimicrobiaceae bacterium]|nr:hypothetical protein [Casimicrobiaceae bacterium]
MRRSPVSVVPINEKRRVCNAGPLFDSMSGSGAGDTSGPIDLCCFIPIPARSPSPIAYWRGADLGATASDAEYGE